jgi:hypothetical protein
MERDLIMTDIVNLDWFAGREFSLTGVDASMVFVEAHNEEKFKDCSVINFTLNGVTYSAIEDPSDGYRSCFGEIRVIKDKLKNTFAPCIVIASRGMGENEDVIMFRDKLTNKVVLEVGTDSSDDYYPSFVASFVPQNMAINSGDREILGKLDDVVNERARSNLEREAAGWGSW